MSAASTLSIDDIPFDELISCLEKEKAFTIKRTGIDKLSLNGIAFQTMGIQLFDANPVAGESEDELARLVCIINGDSIIVQRVELENFILSVLKRIQMKPSRINPSLENLLVCLRALLKKKYEKKPGNSEKNSKPREEPPGSLIACVM